VGRVVPLNNAWIIAETNIARQSIALPLKLTTKHSTYGGKYTL